MHTIKLKHMRSEVTIDQLRIARVRAASTLDGLRSQFLEPWARKQAPTISGARLAGSLKIDRRRLNDLIAAGKLSPGVMKGHGRSREYQLAEAQEILHANSPWRHQRKDCRGMVIACANFKGGVGKTTLAVALAQGLALRGHPKVCLLDLDPQASATTLFGFIPDAEIEQADTIEPPFRRNDGSSDKKLGWF